MSGPDALLDRFRGRLHSAAPAGEEEVSAQRWSYRCSAAVLHCFRGNALQPLDPKLRHSYPPQLLADDVTMSPGGRAQMLLSLKPAVRRAALERLRDAPARRAALARNADRPRTDLQAVLEAWLAEESPDWENESYARLGLHLQVAEWLTGLVPHVPPPEEIRHIMEGRSVLAPFEHLADRTFTGRERELAALRAYVGIDSRSWSESLWTAVRRDNRRPPMMIWGPGGIGKSALLAHFLLEHGRVASEQRLPFAYLPFDDSSLSAGEPLTLVVEIVSEIERQFPERAPELAALRERIVHYRDERGRLARRGAKNSAPVERVAEVRGLDLDLYERLATLLGRVASENRPEPVPTLLVLDTFEEVQYQGPDKVLAVSRLLATLKDLVPDLRVIISGRAAIERMGDLPLELLPLDELDPPDRTLLLERLGVADREVASRVAVQVGGSPLTLRLAARVLQDETAGDQGVRELVTRRWMVLSVSPELIRGQLYRRVLNHIHDDDVRKLAHPGMVLRRVTARIIEDFLANVCGVEDVDEGRAADLLEELKKEHALVDVEASREDAIRFRAEVRAPMLALLGQDRPAQVRAIHRAAAAFYSEANDPIGRAESLYHRLALDEEDPKWLTREFSPEVGDLLAPALEELPPRAVAWLASMMSLKVDPAVFAAADLATWERHAGRTASSLLRHDPGSALKVLRDRRERTPGSALYTLEARVLLHMGDLGSAREVIDRGIASMPMQGNLGRLAEMFWVAAQVDRNSKAFRDADGKLSEAERAAAGLDTPLARIQILVQRILLRRVGFLPPDGALEGRLFEALRALSDANEEPELVSTAVNLLGSEVSRTLIRETLHWPYADPTTGPLEASTLAGIDSYRERWEIEAVLTGAGAFS